MHIKPVADWLKEAFQVSLKRSREKNQCAGELGLDVLLKSVFFLHKCVSFVDSETAKYDRDTANRP